MTRNLKALGLALFAVFAMSAMLASAASAHTPARFTGTPEATVRGNDDEAPTVFKADGFETECEIAEYHGVAANAPSSESQKIVPTYTECETETFIGPISVKVTGFGHYGAEDKGCWYTLTADGKTHLECEPGKEVTLDASNICIIHIPPQTPGGTVSYTTGVRLAKHDLTVHINLTDITATMTDAPSAFFCPLNGETRIHDGTLTGKTTVWAESGGGPVDLTWDATVA